MEEQHREIVIVGAGIAGLSCARGLQQKGHDILVLEAAPEVGGRLQTDRRDGFLLDRGFQVLQLAYPQARDLLDYDALELRRFPPGARIRADNRFHVLADPLRKPRYLLQTVFSGIGSVADRLRLAQLVREVCRPPLEELFDQEETMARDFLVSYGFSTGMIDRFFVPFLAGICLDPQIRVTNRFMLFVLRMFAQGDVAIPARGMGEIPKQLAEDLPEHSIICNAPVELLQGRRVILSDKSVYRAEVIVLATPEPETVRLLGKDAEREACRELCLYYVADEPPVDEPFLILNGEKGGLINSVNFPSMISPDYSGSGETLVSAVVPGSLHEDIRAIDRDVKRELKERCGPPVESWRQLHQYEITHALPRPVPPSPNPFRFKPQLGDNLFHCGEYTTMPSIQWALYSGDRTAEAVTDYLLAR